ncbi:MAG: hypothetical protein AB1813_03835 [Verrucomicrobiota bacterium]
MEGSSENKFAGWQPLTFAGVAAFARAPLRRLLTVQLLTASFAAFVVATCFEMTWAPVIDSALQQLPATGKIQEQTLIWPEAKPRRLADGKFLAIEVDPTDRRDLGQSADFLVELGHREWRVHSVFGYVSISYPGGWVIALNRAEAEPWWGAWKPGWMLGLGASVVVALMVSWSVLAALYMPVVRLLAFLTDRRCTRAGAWRLAGAAMIPGALFLAVALGLYALLWLNLIELMVAFLAHFAVGWVFVAIAPFRLPKILESKSAGSNPFAGESTRKPVKAAPDGETSD